MSEPAKAVFLSYASQDADVARRICDALRAIQVEVWFDQSELRGGDAWDHAIRKQIKECALFVPVISSNTNARLEGYFRREWRLAVDRMHDMDDARPFLVPVVIDETTDVGARVPERFRERQWTRFPETTSTAFAERVQKLLSGEVAIPSASTSVSTAGSPHREDGFWFAVLPFKHRGADDDIAALAEGLTEEIINGLSRFSHLRVITSRSTARYAHEAVDMRTAGKQLGARYVMEGTLRRSGARLRITVQLVDATTGANVWVESFDRPFSPEAAFDLQDELVPRIVNTVADKGVLVQAMTEAVRNLDPAQLTPNEVLLRAMGYYARISPIEHADVRALLERAVTQAPDHADCWYFLSYLYADEFNNGFNPRPDPLGRSIRAARRAIEIEPANPMAHHCLANALFFSREMDAFRAAAERAIALHAEWASNIAYMGTLLAYSGEWERGCALAQRGRQLNPRHEGWLWFCQSFNAYRQHDYRSALEAALNVNMPQFYWNHVALAAIYAQLGQQDAAAKSLQELLALRPDFAAIARQELSKWLWSIPDLVEHFVDGLRKAGLKVAEPTAS